MYEAYFGLKEKPFNLSPDPSFLYMSPGHENVYSHLEYAVRENKGFAVITGEVGSGKTTLINYLIKALGSDNYRVGLISNTDLTPDQLLRMIMLEFGLTGSLSDDRAGQLNEWTGFLARQEAQGRKVILIIDEAQNLSLPALESLRMLSNFEGEREQLMQIILVGQPELREKLKTRELRQLSQRVTVHAHLESLSAQDVHNYINHRLKIAGAVNPEAVFTPEAIRQINLYSKGLPRVINYLCDTAMVYAFADELKVIGEETIASVAATRQIGGLMHKTDSEPKPVAPGPPDSGEAPAGLYELEPLLSRLAALEHRVSSLEEALESRGESASPALELMKQTRRRDEIMLELLKMLNENVAGRQQALGKLYSVYKARKNEGLQARPLTARPNNPLNSARPLTVGPEAAEAQPVSGSRPPVPPARPEGPPAQEEAPSDAPGLGRPAELPRGAAGGLPESGGPREASPPPEPKPHELTFTPHRLDLKAPPPEAPPSLENSAAELETAPKTKSFFSRLTGRKE